MSRPQPTTLEPSRVFSEKEKQEKRQRWIKKWIPLDLYHHDLRSAANAIYDYCEQYAKNPARGNTVVVYGENGCAKTSIARCVFRWQRNIKLLLKATPNPSSGEFETPSACFVNWAKIVDGFKDRERDGFGIIEDLRNCSLLILDDVGAEHDPSKIGVEKLYSVLSSREFRWNIITTNIPPQQWPDKFERRVDSRLWRNAIHIDLSKVPDYSKI